MNVTSIAHAVGDIRGIADNVATSTTVLHNLNTRLLGMDRMFETTAISQPQGVTLANDVRQAALDLSAARDSFLNVTAGATATGIATGMSTEVVNLAELAGRLGSMPGGSHYIAGQCGSSLDGAIAATRDAVDLLTKLA